MRSAPKTLIVFASVLTLTFSIFIPVARATSSALDTLMKDSTSKVDIRYRYEGVDQDGIDKDANANTVRTRLGFQSGRLNNWSFKLEMDDVRAIGAENFNSTRNGNTQYPVVADPNGTDLNQALIHFKSDGFSATAGRQVVLLDDQRFIGAVSWRQNEQSYDGLRLQHSLQKFSLDYSYVTRVNRIFGPSGPNANMEGDIHLLNSAYKFNDAHKITGFVYSMDFDNSIALSNISYGLAYRGDYGFAKLAASYARQTDTGSMPIEYSADYMAIDLSGKMTSTFNWKAGYELLGSDKGDQAFKTPLATLHKFQGWSDKFLATPADGVQDIYAGVSGKMGDVTLKLFYHEFSSDNTSADFGSELDVLAIYPVSQRVKTLLKFASYRADQHATDTSKLWFQLQVSL